jgi:molecular chaperone DnaK (HSP70)
MKLGIDFGTTRTVVAVADRGNYPVVSFQSDAGEFKPWFPSLIAAKGEQICFGISAESHVEDSDWEFLRSVKRLLAHNGPEEIVTLGCRAVPLLDLVTMYLGKLRSDLCERSNLDVEAGEALEVMVAAPANANSNQRFLTLEGFRRAGFRVLGMVNEPSAAGIEFAQRSTSREGPKTREYLLVYDLGGGTFDASIIGMKNRDYEVLADEGITELGGDDFDEILMEMALDQFPEPPPQISPQMRFHLLEECRRQKEGLHPNTRRIVVDLGCGIEGAGEVAVQAEDYYQRCAPLIQKTVSAVEYAVQRASAEPGFNWNAISALYLVGGSSDLPVVGRLLREKYGRRVRRSPYPYSATAIGLAIAADGRTGHTLREKFTRFFGVWREAESGRRIVFDPIFAKGTPLPPAGELLVECRRYSPAHNIGHFRYLECSRVTEDSQPDGDITPWNEVLFSMDPGLSAEIGLEALDILRTGNHAQQVIREEYRCNSQGIIQVNIANETAGYERTYSLSDPSVPGPGGVRKAGQRHKARG